MQIDSRRNIREHRRRVVASTAQALAWMFVILCFAAPVRADDSGEAVVLFDGKTLDGWTTLDGKPVTRGWKVTDGAIHRASKATDIISAEQYGDFDLRFEWKIRQGTNSGLKYKFTRFDGKWLGCEYQVIDDGRNGAHTKNSTGSLYNVYPPNDKKKTKPLGEYNQSRIVVRGSHIEHWLNGEKVVEADTSSEDWKRQIAKSKFKKVEGFGQNSHGHIMLQEHGGEVWFRSITIRKLGKESGSSKLRATPKPNIILIMCDDMGFSDIGCYGGEVETPNLDRLAREGMRFTQFYNNAKCTTTRASILTGLYPRFGGPGHLRQNMITLGEGMKLAGYRTALSGKWHLMKTRRRSKEKAAGDWVDRFDKTTHPFFRGFDSYYGLLDGCSNFFNPVQPDPSYKGGAIRSFGEDDHAVTEFPDDYYTTDAFTDHTIRMIQKYSKSDDPFFLHLCYTCPHYPIHAKPEDIAKYVGKFKKGWDRMRSDRWERQQKMGLAAASWKLTGSDRRSYSWEKANHEFEDLRMAVYAAMIDRMDQNIGRILKTLKETGEADNTLILFLSDNGGCSEEPGGRDPKKRRPGPGDDYVCVGPAWGWAQNAPFRRYKSWVHEGGISTPLIAWMPGTVPGGVINRDPAHIIDLLPTFLDMAETAYPATHAGHDLLPVEGRSMLSLLRGEKREPHASLAWFWARNRAIRQGQWKLVWDSGVRKWELYDIDVDRCESEDLAQKYPQRAERMAADWYAWAKKVGLSEKSYASKKNDRKKKKKNKSKS
jgi:arylsulfatase